MSSFWTRRFVQTHTGLPRRAYVPTLKRASFPGHIPYAAVDGTRLAQVTRTRSRRRHGLRRSRAGQVRGRVDHSDIREGSDVGAVQIRGAAAECTARVGGIAVRQIRLPRNVVVVLVGVAHAVVGVQLDVADVRNDRDSQFVSIRQSCQFIQRMPTNPAKSPSSRRRAYTSGLLGDEVGNGPSANSRRTASPLVGLRNAPTRSTAAAVIVADAGYAPGYARDAHSRHLCHK